MESNQRSIYEVSVKVPGGVIKKFRTDEWDEDITIARFEQRYGKENIKILEKKQV